MAKQTFTTGQVLTAAQMTSLQQTAMLGGAASAKTASYTLVAADAGSAISMSNASATTITVNTALFAAGDTVQITNLGAGVCTITAGTATVNTSASLALAQYESGTLNFTSTSNAIFIKGAGGAAAGGGMTLINTGGTTLTGASVTISSIPATYKHLYLILTEVYFASTGDFYMRVNADTGNNYSFSEITNTNTTVSGYSNGATTAFILGLMSNSSTIKNRGAWAIWVPLYTDTTSVGVHSVGKTYNGTVHSNRVLDGVYDGTAAITSITLFADGNFSGGTAYLYGVS
jgi:hypothetical protein